MDFLFPPFSDEQKAMLNDFKRMRTVLKYETGYDFGNVESAAVRAEISHAMNHGIGCQCADDDPTADEN